MATRIALSSTRQIIGEPTMLRLVDSAPLWSEKCLRTFQSSPSNARMLHTNNSIRSRHHAYKSLPVFVQYSSVLGQQQLRNASQEAVLSRRARNRAYDMGLGALMLFGVVSAGTLIYSYSGHVSYEETPITNRKRFLWTNTELDEELGHPMEDWLLNQREKPRLSEDDPITRVVRQTLDKLLVVDAAKGIKVKLYVFHDFAEPNAYGAPGLGGGRIFINTGCIYACKNVEDLAGVLAHELGHVIARHVLEMNFNTKVAQSIARWFGYKGVVGTDLITLRTQEEEADRMGMIIMAEAGFDPESRVHYFENHWKLQKEHLAGREPLPEFLSTHPLIERRIKIVESMLPKAKEIFTKRGNVADEIKGWDEARTPLATMAEIYKELVAIGDQMRPELMVIRMESTVRDLVAAWNYYANAMQGIREDDEANKEAEDADVAKKTMEESLQKLETEQEIIKEGLHVEAGDMMQKMELATKESCSLPPQTAIPASEDNTRPGGDSSQE